jgi:hypothetical protein
VIVAMAWPELPPGAAEPLNSKEGMPLNRESVVGASDQEIVAKDENGAMFPVAPVVPVDPVDPVEPVYAVLPLVPPVLVVAVVAVVPLAPRTYHS